MFKAFRRLGTVTSKLQHRREKFIKSKYPEYAGNRVIDVVDTGRKGRRLGGLYADSSKPPMKLDGSESFYNTDERDALIDDFAERLRNASSDPSALQSVVEQYRAALEEFETTKDPISHERARKIKEVTSIDYAAQSKNVKPMKLIPTKRRDTDFPVVREEGEMFDTISRVKDSPASSFWDSQGAKRFIEISSLAVPAVFTSSMSEYHSAKTNAAVFESSYKQSLVVSGEDSMFVMDHFVSAPLRSLNIGDSANSCILDSKGYVLGTAVVSRTGDIDFEILLDEYRESVFRYLAQYVVYSRQSGMQVSIKPESGAIISLIGPKSTTTLLQALTQLQVSTLALGVEGEILPELDYLRDVPPMTLVSAWTDHSDQPVALIRRLAGNSLPQFTISLNKDILLPFLSSLVDESAITCAGAYAWDMIRMENGVPRPDIDIPSSTSSPIKASLACLVDQRKVRENILFGHDRISSELLRGTTHRRVGIVSTKYIYGGCKILSTPHRHVIGEISSCAWSPLLNKRVCQAYVKPEYAVASNPVVVNVPLSVPESLSYRFKRRIVRQGALQNVFRKLCPAHVASFPIE